MAGAPSRLGACCQVMRLHLRLLLLRLLPSPLLLLLLLLLRLLLLPLPPLPLLYIASTLAVLAFSVQTVHKSLREVKSGCMSVPVALLAALACHSHLDERCLAVLADDPLAFSADVLQAVSAATLAIEAV